MNPIMMYVLSYCDETKTIYILLQNQQYIKSYVTALHKIAVAIKKTIQVQQLTVKQENK